MPRDPEVHTITSASVGITQDQRARQRVYLLSMALRTACFLAAIVVDGPIRWLLAGSAVVLPYFAVVLANSGRARSDDADVTFVDRHAIGDGSTRAT